VGIVKKQGISNTVLIYVGTLIGFVSLVFIQPIYLSKEELGLTRLILSFSSVLSVLFSVGISAVTVRYLPKTFDPGSRHRGYFGFLLAYTCAGILAGSCVLYFAKDLILRFYSTGAKVFTEQFDYVLLLTVILSFVLGFNAYCIALMRSTLTTVLNDIVVRVLLIAIIFFRFSGLFDLEQFLLAFCLIYAVQALVLLAGIFRFDTPGLIPDFGFIKGSIGMWPILRYGLIITLTALNSVTLKYIDTMFVGRISLEMVAIYSVAAFLGLAVEIPLNALERIANPSISHALARQDMVVVRTVYHDSSKALLLIGGWLFLMVALNVRDLFSFLPDEYSAGVIVAQVISFGALINMGTGVNYPILANSKKYIWGSVFLVILLVLTIIGNILLIPEFGMLGPAISGCMASIVYNALKFEYIRRNFGMQPFDRATLKHGLLIAACLLLGMTIPLHLHPILSMIVRAVLISCAYLAGVVLLRTSKDLYHHIPEHWMKRLPFLR
jgi:O-antigen/teichoic acid export membrane protein